MIRCSDATASNVYVYAQQSYRSIHTLILRCSALAGIRSTEDHHSLQKTKQCIDTIASTHIREILPPLPISTVSSSRTSKPSSLTVNTKMRGSGRGHNSSYTSAAAMIRILLLSSAPTTSAIVEFTLFTRQSSRFVCVHSS